ncbi:MAG TPA: 30S ribosomal protein S18 [Bacteroidota bacterium]|nr:30S ribosomal protein S18 [Bacteroidota bacterium]
MQQRGGPGQRGGPQRGGMNQRGPQIRKKRVCRFCEHKDVYIDYKNEKKLQRFVSEQGRIIPKRITGTCSRHQRMLVQAIKRARHLALLPYVSEAVK